MTSKTLSVAVKLHYSRAEAWISKNRLAATLLVLIVAAVLMLTRRPDILFNAQFWAEDGAVWYTDAYHNNLLSVIFRPYPDYLAVVQRILASAAALLPMKNAPLFFNVSALLVQLLPIVLIMSGRLKRLVSSNLLAVSVCFLYVGVLNVTEVYSSFTNLQWLLGVPAFLVLVAEPSKQIGWKIFDVAVLVAMGLSGPPIYILALVAFFVWQATKGKQQLYNLILVSALSALQLFTMLFLSNYERVAGHPAMDFFTFVKIVVGQLITGGILGEKNMTLFYANPLQMYIAFLAMVILVCYVLVKAPLWLKLFNVFGILTVASMLATLKPVAGFNVFEGLANPTAGQRYWYFAILAMITNLLWLIFAARSTLAKCVAASLMILMLLIGIPQGWQLRKLHDYHYRQYVQKFESTPPGKPFTFPINPGGWQVTLYKK